MIARGHAKQQAIIILALHCVIAKTIFFLLTGPAALNKNASKNVFWIPLHLLVCDTTIKVMARGPWCDPKEHNTRKYQDHEQRSQEHKQSKTMVQRRHQMVFQVVETNHKDHNILSFDAAETRKQAPGGYPPDHNKICLFSSLVFDKGYFSSLTWMLTLFWSAGNPGSFRQSQPMCIDTGFFSRNNGFSSKP
jgi:hypothetical protein